MVRESLKKKSSFGSKLAGFALLNIIPIAGFAWVAVAVHMGKLDLEEALPEGAGRNAVYLVASLVLLIVVTTFLLPGAHFCASRLHMQMGWSAEVRKTGGFFRTIWELLLLPFRAVFYAVFWTFRFIGYLLAFGLIALVIVFMVRMLNPEFLVDHVKTDEWVTWAQERWGG